MTNTSVPQPNKEPYYPPTRQDYRDLIEHHYLIRAFTFFPLIIVAVSMYMAADYGPLHFLTGVAMNVGVLATCLTVPLAIPVMIRDAREARERGVDKAIPRRRLWKVAGRVAISLAFGAISIAYLTPFVRDATDGSRNVTVTSCTNTVAQRQQRSVAGPASSTTRSTRSRCSSPTVPPACRTCACTPGTTNLLAARQSTTCSTRPA